LFDANTDELLGAHFIGDNITEMIAEMVVMKKLKGKARDLIKSIHLIPVFLKQLWKLQLLLIMKQFIIKK
jgi:pyruvate/2-oxoglutarate dehydrogenase complex dihydrolipoamide dehydrogenase (E3) component